MCDFSQLGKTLILCTGVISAPRSSSRTERRSQSTRHEQALRFRVSSPVCSGLTISPDPAGAALTPVTSIPLLSPWLLNPETRFSVGRGPWLPFIAVASPLICHEETFPYIGDRVMGCFPSPRLGRVWPPPSSLLVWHVTGAPFLALCVSSDCRLFPRRGESCRDCIGPSLWGALCLFSLGG